jgi:hypothetical protein
MQNQDNEKELSYIIPNLRYGTFILERPQVSFKVHTNFENEVYRIKDPRLNDANEWKNPWGFTKIFLGNIKQAVDNKKSIFLIKYNIFVAMCIGDLWHKCIDYGNPPFACLAFYHDGENLTSPKPVVDDANFTCVEDIEAMEENEIMAFLIKVHQQYHTPIDTKTTALESMEYYDFISKVEIPRHFELTLPFVGVTSHKALEMFDPETRELKRQD